ncbi:MAG: hypothetical protein BM485_00385 [Desulfobulbaceae bacterium DB1]|nr:MAG: hypothetical protein BM485_00385 [Desulfobulbaceae bacterium DB1]
MGNVAEVYDGPHATPKKIEQGPYFLSISSLENGALDLSKSAHLSEKDFVKWTKRVTPQEGDLLFSYETRLGEAALMPSNITACLGRRMGLLRPNTNKVIPEYLLYAYLSPSFQETIRSKTIHGATVDRIALKEMPSFPIRIPPKEEQIVVVNVLKDHCSKIELNRRINQTLEEMAQAIFKSWFVDFEPVKAKTLAKANGQDPERAAMCAISGKSDAELDHLPPGQLVQLRATAALFPDELIDSELGLIPKGWEVKSMRELAEIITKGTTPRKPDVLVAKDPAIIPFIKVKDLTDSGEILRASLEMIPESIHEKALKRSILKTNDLLFSIAGTIGRVSLIEKDLHNSNVNQALAIIRLKDIENHLWLCLQTLKCRRIRNEIASKVVQGVQANASLANIGDIRVLVPRKNLLAAWNKLIAPFNLQKMGVAQQIRDLSQLRDTLLPKLLSGEISVNAAEPSIKEAV